MISSLTFILLTLAHWKEAEDLVVQILEHRNRTLGNSHPDTLHISSSLATTYRKLGEQDSPNNLKAQVLQCLRYQLDHEMRALK